MDLQPIASMISNIGFPCVMCLIIIGLMIKQNDAHKEEMAKITESLNNNTNALIQLTAKLDVYANAKE
jgi:hypothetical protein